ncbi:hypothetical protein M1771_04285 [Spiroplasma citri]|uniref:Phage protein n=1 Tax=Spiroplasma citri TaxID=2133 RepID=A0AAX3T0Z9_SPICI|nr:hypothetical protein [Spiroplasma citri]WFG97226.1 hypothetical protein M0C40_04300 [Spiroplasma citri]WFH01124.1 hypothetical protein M1771_04285 [Spiroplasma citri]
MKEIRNLQLSEFQKEIINKLDDEYCYKISYGFGIYGEYVAIKIFNKEMEHLFTIEGRDNTVSINNYIEKLKKKLELLELILKENK